MIEHLVKTLRFSRTAKGRHGLSLVMAAEWDGFTTERLLRGSRCHIDVRRTDVPGITLNGEAVEGDTVPYERLATGEPNEISVAI